MSDRWPGYDERPAVIVNSGSRGYRPLYYPGPSGALLVPAGGRVHRSSSTSSRHRQAEYRTAGYPQPAPVTIVNENITYDDHMEHERDRRYRQVEYRKPEYQPPPPPPPAPVTIVNENITYDEHMERERERDRRPRSPHGRRHSRHYYREEEYSDRSRSRSRSRVRFRDHSPYYEQRLEQQLAETRLEHKVESEVEIRARLKKLDELERKEREEKERRRMEDLQRLENMERKDREEKERRRIQEELILEQAKREAEAARKKKEEEEIRHRAIEEYNLKQAEEKAKKKKEEEEAAKELKDKMWRTLHNAGYSDEEIEKILKDGEKKKHGAGHDHKTHLLIENGESSSTTTIVNLSKPTYIKVNKKYLETATLEYYELPWEYDSVSNSTLTQSSSEI
jgi:hypothetical protein